MNTPACRICGGPLTPFLDLGRQPLSDAFVDPGQKTEEFFYDLVVAVCGSCTMVQLVNEVPRDRMFHADYPYHSSGSSRMREHFEQTARDILASRLQHPEAFLVEIGCNDGVMLATIAGAGVRHLGVDPSAGVLEVAREKQVRVMNDFFEESTAKEIAASDGPADVIYAANTICHIPYLDSVLRGVDALLSDDGVFIFEDPYFGAILEQVSFDQIYDEHFYLFSARSVQMMVRRFGFDLVDVELLGVHGGEVRYTIARAGVREPAASVASLVKSENERGLADLEVLHAFAQRVEQNRDELVALLTDLRDAGHRVVGYGATAKSATVANYCGLGPHLVEFITDTTPAKQNRLTPGSGIPIRDHAAFRDAAVDHAVLFAWNHADEIMAKESEFRDRGGRWIRYVPHVHIT